MMGPQVAICLALLCMAGSLDAQTGIPVFVDYSDVNDRYLPENLTIGTRMGEIDAYDPDNTELQYFIEGGGGEYFNIDNNGTITLKKLLDAENEIEIRMTIRLVDEDGEQATVQTKVFVNDVNDNAPVFEDDAISLVFPESRQPGYLVAFINVTDRDTSNSVLRVDCSPGTSARFQDACSKFRLEPLEPTNKGWTGNLILAQPLDYEERSSYAIPLRAFDGRFNVTNEVHVELEDVNDSPPRWIRSGPATIPEEQPVPTVFTTVSAEDSDSTNKNPIYYELVGDSANVFNIDPRTGEISNRIRLDYDAVDFPKSEPFNVIIKASEILNATTGERGNDPLTTSTIVIKVTVQDINDNSPTFNEARYTATIPENIASNANVPGLQMSITDIDSGTFNSFDLVTLAHNDVFGIIPSEDAASSSATLYVIDGERIDFENGPREYIIPVEARENQVLPAFTGNATVVITVRDVNDVTPSFDDLFYNRTISELATPGTVIIDLDATDPEAGIFGTAGIRYQLYGNIPPHFEIDDSTGVIRIAPCNPPGSPGTPPCIDFETKRQYALSVSATDDNGSVNGRTRSVNLNVRVTDENDNVPRLEDSYLRYIREDERVTINPLRIDASDPDTVGSLTFSIQGDSTGLWQIQSQVDPITGELYDSITARRNIMYSDAPNRTTGAFEFGVVVDDGRRTVSSPVTIIVLDINNNAPEFENSLYIESIPESTLGDVFITRVTATDGDTPTTDNGVIDFSISRGALGKFVPRNVTRVGNSFVADIYTTSGATFNYQTQDRYEMTLVARDRGTPSSLTGTATLIVNILDTNNRNPRIYPSFQSINVMENEPVGTSVYQVSASDPDTDSILRFFMSASSATDGTGNVVDRNFYDFSNLFRIDQTTGNVFVNGTLDRDRAARITHDLVVRDVQPAIAQEGTGILLIHVLEYNDQAPQFNQTSYTINIPEELNINSFVQNFFCIDEDDQIAAYTLTQNSPRRPEFFSFIPGSGAMIVTERIDFEQIERIELTASCLDNGVPQLFNTTRIFVNVININDNTPEFDRSIYSATLPEGSTGNVLNVNVRATDIDKGDYGVVRYMLQDAPNGWFEIDEITGRITVLPAASFDREVSESIGFQVVAYDSPLDPSVRRQSSVPVYITISDINDNCPTFDRLFYSGTVPESASVGTDIIDIIASDRDVGVNAMIVFSIQPGSGDPAESENLFGIGVSNGRVLVDGNLRGRAGIFRFNVTATDMNGQDPVNQCSTTVPVEVEVQESLNDAPEWIRPPNRNYAIYVLESQYEGMLVYNAKAVDSNRGPNGVVDYFFNSNENELVANTPEFRINRVTGVIRAEVVFDREQRDNYFLTLMARDRGNPAASSETTLVVVILDVDDNDPVFPMRNGVVVPLNLGVNENGVLTPANTPLGRCSATDADSDVENNRIFYRILAAQDNVRDYVSVDRTTCEVTLLRPVAYEDFPTLEFDILAYNEKNDDSVRRNKREVNPSVQHVVVTVEDRDDHPPVFTQERYFGCVSVDAPYRQTILEVSATDVDVDSRIQYSLNDYSTFGISSTLGTIYNLASFNSDSQKTYSLTATASDGIQSSSVPVSLFVTSPSNIVRLKVNRPLTDVQPFSQQLVNTIIQNSNGEIVSACIDTMRNHIDGDGTESLMATDVLLTAIRNEGGNYVIYPAGDLVGVVRNQMDRPDSPYTAISVSEVEVEGDDDGWSLEEDAVLAILIICILLIFLALLLCCIGCYCIRNSKKRKEKKLRAQRHTVVQVAHEPVETSFNPVYHNAGDEYSTIQKARPMASPIAPVVIQAPQFLEPVPSEEPPTYLAPIEEPQVYVPEEPEPVIETEVMPDPEPIRDPEPYRPFEPEFEDRIETEVVDNAPADFLPPPHVDVIQVDPDEDIDVEIRDSPNISPPDSPREVPHVTVVQTED